MAEALPDILKRAKAAPLFKHVGEPIEDKTVKAVGNWDECLKSLRGNKWVNIGTSMMNRIFAVVDVTRDSAWMTKNWDRMVDSRKALILRTISPALKSVMRKHKLPKPFEYFVIGDFLKAWLLTEYEDDLAAAWSNRTMEWYLAGHVPCGYSGSVPAGKSTDPTTLPDPAKGKLFVY